MALLKKHRDPHTSDTAAAPARGDQPVAHHPVDDGTGGDDHPAAREPRDPRSRRGKRPPTSASAASTGGRLLRLAGRRGAAGSSPASRGPCAPARLDQNITRADAEASAGTYGVAAAVILLVIMSLAYYAGGYVSGRMSRFDGGKQGLGVWMVGLLVSLVAVAIGAVAGSEYDIFERVNLPTLPLTSDELGLGGLLAALAILVATLLFAMAGGKVGTRYHTKVDRAVGV